MNIQPTLFSLNARISGKKGQNRRSIFLRTSVCDFYLLVTESEDFEVVKDISTYSFGGCKTWHFRWCFDFERITGLSYQMTRELRGTRQHRISLKCCRCREKNLIRRTFHHTLNQVGNHCCGYSSYNRLVPCAGILLDACLYNNEVLLHAWMNDVFNCVECCECAINLEILGNWSCARIHVWVHWKDISAHCGAPFGVLQCKDMHSKMEEL